MRAIHLVRHAPSHLARPGQIAGRLDVPARIPDSPFDGVPPWNQDALWVTSGALRATQTAAYLGARDALCDDRLWEQSHGLWEGQTWDEVLNHDPQAKTYLAGFDRIRPPQGESLLDVRRRSARALRHWRNHTPRDLVLVCHAGPIRCLVAQALGLSTRRSTMLEIANLSVTTLADWGDHGFSLVRCNHPLNDPVRHG